MSTQIDLVTLKCVSPERVLDWAERLLPNGDSIGELTKAETVHYRTLQPRIGGLFCQQIFGTMRANTCECKKGVIRVPGRSKIKLTRRFNEFDQIIHQKYAELAYVVDALDFHFERFNYFKNLYDSQQTPIKLNLSEITAITDKKTVPFYKFNKSILKLIPSIYNNEEYKLQTYQRILPNQLQKSYWQLRSDSVKSRKSSNISLNVQFTPLINQHPLFVSPHIDGSHFTKPIVKQNFDIVSPQLLSSKNLPLCQSPDESVGILYRPDPLWEAAVETLETRFREDPSCMEAPEYSDDILCPRCGVFRKTHHRRRYQIGYINLLFYCAHIWYLKTRPCIFSILLDLPRNILHQIVYLQRNFSSRPNYCMVKADLWTVKRLTSCYTYLSGHFGYLDEAAPWNQHQVNFKLSINDFGSLSLFRVLHSLDITQEIKDLEHILVDQQSNITDGPIENQSFSLHSNVGEAYRVAPTSAQSVSNWLKNHNPFFNLFKLHKQLIELYGFQTHGLETQRIWHKTFVEMPPIPNSSNEFLIRKHHVWNGSHNKRSFIQFLKEPLDQFITDPNVMNFMPRRRDLTLPVDRDFFSLRRHKKESKKSRARQLRLNILRDWVLKYDKKKRKRVDPDRFHPWRVRHASTASTAHFIRDHLSYPKIARGKQAFQNLAVAWVSFYKSIGRSYLLDWDQQERQHRRQDKKYRRFDTKTFFFRDNFQNVSFGQNIKVFRIDAPYSL